MALTNIAPQIVIQLRDQSGRLSNLTFQTTLDPATMTLGDLTTARDNLVAALDPLTDAVIVRADAQVLQEDGAAGYGTKFNTEYAAITLRIDSTEVKNHTVRLPAPVDGLFIGTSGPDAKRVDVTNADLLTYKALFHTGGSFALSDGETLDAAIAPLGGVRRFKKAKEPASTA